MEDIIIGSHVSFKRDGELVLSVKEACSYGANTFMFYTGAPQNTVRSEINDELTKEAYRLMAENKIDPASNEGKHCLLDLEFAANEFNKIFIEHGLDPQLRFNCKKIV